MFGDDKRFGSAPTDLQRDINECRNNVASATKDLLKIMPVWAGLAPLPSRATDARLHKSGEEDAKLYDNLSSSSPGYYLKFSATPDQINAFIAASPAIPSDSIEVFSHSHQYLPPEERPYAIPQKQWVHSYFWEYYTTKHTATWFNRAIRQSGRLYQIYWRNYFGELVVDDANNTVYIIVREEIISYR